MSILTKISIVVLVLLNIVAAVLFINQARMVPAYRSHADALGTRVNDLTAEAHAQQLATERMRAQMATTQTRSDEELRAARQNIDRLQQELVQLRVERDNQQQQLGVLAAQFTDLSTTLDKEIEQRVAAQNELRAQRDEYAQLSDRARQMSESLMRTQSQLESYDRANRHLREQLADRDSQITELNRQLADMRTAGPQTAQTGSFGGPVDVSVDRPITGQVTAFRGDMNIASVNVGSAQGVRPGMTLMIYRGANFVGYLNVEDVDTNQSAGMVTDLQTDVRQGDRVATLTASF